MSGPAKWDWHKSNGTATAAATVAAYEALNTGGQTRAFSATVWNDILSKISEQRVFWTDTAWDKRYLSYAATQMASGTNMTAERFNTAIKNMPPIKTWPWTQPLGRTDLRARDRCYGLYFIYLTDGLNYWIDLVPLPFAVTNIATTALDAMGYVAPAIHIRVEKPLSSLFTSTVTARAAPVARVKYRLDVTQQGTLYLSALNAAHISIINFVHVDFENKVSLYPTEHIIAKLNMAFQHKASVTFGNCEFLQINIPFHYSGAMDLHTDPVVPIYADILMGKFNTSATISAALYTYFGFDLSAVLKGEPRICELDSIPIAAMLQMLNSPAVTISCQDMNPMLINLAAVFNLAAKLASDTALNFSADLRTQALIRATLSIPDIISLVINENAGMLDIRAQLFRVLSIPLASDLPSAYVGKAYLSSLGSISLSAKLRSECAQILEMSFKDTLHVISSLLFKSSLTAPIDTLHVLHVITAMIEHVGVSANTGLLERQLIQAFIQESTCISGMAVIKAGAFFAAQLLSSLNTAASIQAMSRTHVMLNIIMQWAAKTNLAGLLGQSTGVLFSEKLMLAARADIKDLQASGTEINGIFRLAARGATALPEIYGAKLESLFGMTVTGMDSVNPQYTGVELTGLLSGRASMTSAAAGDGITVLIPTVFTGLAQAKLLTRMHIEMFQQFQHEAQGAITLAAIFAVFAKISSLYTGEAALSLVNPLAVFGDLQMVHTVTTQISLMGLTLVTEIDNILVTDLDDMLVTDVEYKLK